MKLLLVVTFLLTCNLAVAQYRHAHSTQKVGEFVLDQNGHRIKPAEFKNEFKGWMKYLKRHLRYPKIAKENRIEGKVLVQFSVDSTGAIKRESVKVVQGLCDACDLEAIRIVRESPRWIPARDIDAGRNIESQLVYSIRFRL